MSDLIVLHPHYHTHYQHKTSHKDCLECSVIERLAVELHLEHRAAEKAMNRGSAGRGSLNILMHDHGWTNCSKKKYFTKRAALVIARSQVTNPQTLGQAEQALDALILMRRLIVGA